MKLAIFRCERCGAQIEIPAGASARHIACPQKTMRHAAPRYRQVPNP